MTTSLCQDDGNTRSAAIVDANPPVSTVDLRGNARYEGRGVTLNGTGSGNVLSLSDAASFGLLGSRVDATGQVTQPRGTTACQRHHQLRPRQRQHRWHPRHGDGELHRPDEPDRQCPWDRVRRRRHAHHRQQHHRGQQRQRPGGRPGRGGGTEGGAPIVHATDVIITTRSEAAGVANGYASFGVSALQARVNLTGGSVDAANAVAGDAAVGLWTDRAGIINARSVSVSSSNIGALNTDGTLVLGDDARSGAPIHTVINGAQYGLLAQNYNATVDTTVPAANARIAASAGPGVGLDGGAIVSLIGTTVSGSTAGVQASDADGTGLANVVTVDGGSVAASAGPAFLADGGNANILVKGGVRLAAADGNILQLRNA